MIYWSYTRHSDLIWHSSTIHVYIAYRYTIYSDVNQAEMVSDIPLFKVVSGMFIWSDSKHTKLVIKPLLWLCGTGIAGPAGVRVTGLWIQVEMWLNVVSRAAKIMSMLLTSGGCQSNVLLKLEMSHNLTACDLVDIICIVLRFEAWILWYNPS